LRASSASPRIGCPASVNLNLRPQGSAHKVEVRADIGVNADFMVKFMVRARRGSLARKVGWGSTSVRLWLFEARCDS
jgi:hypothetical protein